MSYSFNFRAATKAGAIAKVAEELAKIVQGQPIHAKDQAQAQGTAEAFIDRLADDETKDVYGYMSGSLSWTDGEKITSANVSVTASLTNKEAPK